MKYCFGVISKNQVDIISDYSLKYNKEIIFIPSRRQIEYNGGYVNNWTTKDFSNYVKSKNLNIKIQRDHGGPGQGLNDDDGFESLKEDCKYFDLIHIDPWKKYPLLKDGIKWTIDLINFCYNLNPNIMYEIGTEEAIRPYTHNDLDEIISSLRIELSDNVFSKIKYCVIQCGNSLINCTNNNLYDETKLVNMIKIVKKYGLTTKEHNGDYNDIDIIKKKEIMGLEYINIAPEFGTIESSVILEHIKHNINDYQDTYNLCIESGKWKKWVSNDFDFINKKDEIILIACHYIYSNDIFIKIKNTYNNIDKEIKNKILNKLLYWDKYYNFRKECCMCNSNNLESLLNNDLKSQLSLNLHDYKNKNPLIPYNILLCNDCNTTQNKYLGNIQCVYETNHIDSYGITKNKKHNLFKNFIVENDKIKSICEIGSPDGELGNNIISEKNIEYTIIEYDYKGKLNNKLKIIKSFFEDVNEKEINTDCLIMSDLFEHFYNPILALEKIKKCNFEYIILNHPEFDHAIENKHCIMLNIEHTFLIEHQYLFKLFNNYGYKLNRRYNYMNFSIFLEFKKTDYLEKLTLFNINTKKNTINFINQIKTIAENINEYINNNKEQDFYIWPCSVHSCTLFLFGLEYKKFKGILDNSPNKIGKYIDGYNLYCSSFNEVIKNTNNNVTIIISGANAYISELNLNDNINIKFMEDFE